ncbi:MAG: hypothetical protein GWP91_16205 [Rhodobacterales bacterium]|nr:hypothetical protein [Rhodobacterales bacterium]
MNQLTRRQPWAVTRVAGATGAALLVAASTLLGGSLLDFVHAPAILTVGGITVAALTANHGVAGVFRPWRTLLSGGGEAALEQATAFFLQMGGVSLATGVLGTLIGFVQMLSNFNDPTAIGPAAALSLLSAFYGIGLAMLAFSAAIGTARRAPQAELATATSGVAAIALTVGAFALGIPVVGNFFVLLLSMSTWNL